MIRRKIDEIEIHDINLAEDVAKRLTDNGDGNRMAFSVDIVPHCETDERGFKMFTGATLSVYEII